LLQAFEESADWTLFASFCDDSQGSNGVLKNMEKSLIIFQSGKTIFWVC